MGLATSNFGYAWSLGASGLQGIEIPQTPANPNIGTYGFRSIGVPSITCGVGSSVLAPLLAVDDDANRANVETLAMFQAQSDAASTHHAGTAVRASGSAGTENGYLCYVNQVLGYLTIAKIVSGTLTALASYDFSSQLTATAADFYVRFRVNGSTLSARVWRYDAVDMFIHIGHDLQHIQVGHSKQHMVGISGHGLARSHGPLNHNPTQWTLISKRDVILPIPTSSKTEMGSATPLIVALPRSRTST